MRILQKIATCLLFFALLPIETWAATPCIKHTFVNPHADSLDPTITGSSEWNECHTIEDASIGASKLDFDPATQAELNAHEADTTSVHGIANTANLGLTTGTLGQFAATTSAQLAGVLSDEEGSSGGFVRAGGNVATATALAANGANCSGNNFALGVDASGVGECAQPAFSNLSGAATDAQIPNNITIDLATAATALAANPADCTNTSSDKAYAATIAANGDLTCAILYHTAPGDPTVNDDSGDNYTVGTVWRNSSTGSLFILVDSTVAAADWDSLAIPDHGVLSGLLDDDHTQYGLITAVASFVAGSCARLGEVQQIIGTLRVAICFSAGGNPVDVATLSDGYTTVTGDSGSATASGPDTIKMSGGTGLTTTCANGAPDTCTIEIDSGGVTVAKVAAPLKTGMIMYSAGCDNCSVLADADDDDGFFYNDLAALTITAVRCFAKTGSPIINLQRDDGSAANVLSSNLTCSNAWASGTIDTAEDNLAVGQKLNFVLVTAGGVAKGAKVAITYTLD
jgi:hypothetical protein